MAFLRMVSEVPYQQFLPVIVSLRALCVHNTEIIEDDFFHHDVTKTQVYH